MSKLRMGGFFLLFTFATTNLSSGCFQHEREALLRFKQSLSDRTGRLSSWNGNNCCNWQGIGCNNATGYVTRLDLRLDRRTIFSVDMLEANVLNSSLAELSHLRYMDLSGNYFGNSPIPEFIGSLTQLRYLKLSYAGFSGIVPHSIGNLSNLRVLDLSDIELVVDDFTWFSSLLSLKSVYLRDHVSHVEAPNLYKVLFMISSLRELSLSGCRLSNSHFHRMHLELNLTHSTIQTLYLQDNLFQGEFPLFLRNLSSLQVLDLSFNRLNSSIAFMNNVQDTMFCQLKRLYLSYNSIGGRFTGPSTNVYECPQFALEALNLYGNHIVGEIPTSLGRLTALTELNLGWNELKGSIPMSIRNLLLLQKLDLSSNLLNGTIPFSLGQLSNLEILSIAFNWFQGIVTEAHFTNTSMLTTLDATSNYRLSFKISPNWKPPFQIRNLELGSCKIESDFPQWIRAQTSLEYLDLSNTSISGPLPDWVDNLPLWFLDLSNNFRNGPLTNLVSNHSRNYSRVLYILHLKNNLFNGSIPDSLCNVTSHIMVLDLSRNMLSGTLPECFGNLQNLKVLIVSSNRLSGVIPKSLGKLGSSLRWLALNNNSFHGELPKTLANCTRLALLNLGENRFFGNIPKWIGENITFLNILRLHKNSFAGPVPVELCECSKLQIMDLGENKLTGSIPRCLQNFSAMTGGETGLMSSDNYNLFNVGFSQACTFELSLSLVMKGVFLEYTKTLEYVVNIDLSSNKLVGEIPKELVLLSGLVGLNLSNNHLRGRIPDRIGDMNSLESLDLSINHLSGMIPQSLSALTFLSHLNLSHNNLSGKIPTGSQLQTLTDPSIYAVNNELCGSPLPINCNHDEVPETGRNAEEDEDDDGDEKIWIYGATCGFTTGFMGIVGILVLKNRWRLVFFNFVGYYIGKKL